MRLITHNMLICNKKGVENGFPLIIQAKETQEISCEFNEEFILRIVDRLDWTAFVSGAKQIGLEQGLPEEGLTDSMKEDEQLLKRIHHALLEVHVTQGILICPESGREFPIKDSIPNMLLNEDEV